MKDETMRIGDYSEESEKLNYMLQKLGYKISNVTNSYDEQTKIAVASFQNDTGLSVTGEVDARTLNILDNMFNSRFPHERSILENNIEKETSINKEKSTNIIKEEKIVKTFINKDNKEKKFAIENKATKRIRPTISIGSRGSDVVYLQQKLVEFGFTSANIDGIFGDDTRRAVVNFQQVNGLGADGIVGSSTWNAIDNYVPNPNLKPTLRQGDQGAYVVELQRKLIEYKFLPGYIDGEFGAETKTAVINFQRTVGLTADGVVGAKTWIALDNYIPDPNYRPTLRQGDQGSYVVELQAKLIEYGFLSGFADGKFGSGTKVAVINFQKAVGLTADGVVGAKTWIELDKYDPDTGKKPTIRQGDSGPFVLLLQKKLTDFGYLGGEINGIFNQRTRIAVETFQHSNGMRADGVVGETTWYTIDHYVGNPNIKPTLRQGNTGTYVKMLQEKLAEYSFYSGIPDGNFDFTTTKSVERFQSANGMTADGVVGAKTWLAIENYNPGGGNRPTLRRGDSGSLVLYVQNKFIFLGLFDDQVTGIFGLSTEKAVIRFQVLNHLTADGVIGRTTWNALDKYIDPFNNIPMGSFDNEAVETFNFIEDDNAKVQNVLLNNQDTRATTRPTLRQGDQGTYVVQLQQKLIEFGFLTGSADGKFGAGTKEAVMKFQRAVGVTADGVVGRGTWYEIDTYIGGTNPPTKPTLRQGDQGAYVIELQTLLKRYGFLTGAIDGKFGAGTKDAVIRFQRAVGLSADGVVGPSTWRELAYYNEEEDDHPTLREGDSGDYVVILQEMLKKLKFFNGKIDGKFGPATKTAVILFQSVVGLTADGVVGKKTWLALENYTENPGEDYPTIREGDQGEYVRILQQKLKEFGFFSGTVDGKFGASTKSALRLFQSTVGLTADGVCGKITWEALFNYTGGSEQYPILRQGSSGEYVLILQQKLKDLGYFRGIVDGLFGPNTTESVKAFQRAMGLPADGVVGASTWNALLNHEEGPENYPTIQFGDTGGYVTILQTRLKELGYYYGSITGVFDAPTQRSLIEFQENNELTADGICGTSTWLALFPDSGGEIPGTRPVLRYGDTGEHVKYLQEELKKLMYYDGEITGVFDNATLTAVKAFQANNRLAADGVVGVSTWSVLQSLYPPVVDCR